MSFSDRSKEAKSNSPRYDNAASGAAFVSNGREQAQAFVPPENADGSLSKETAKLYKSFMQSYVKRINDATYRVPIEGIRIGSAKYSRLAQINLKTRIITFSRFAIENVPERGRRYLVLHELAHVLEASHNKTFWHLVGQFEPDYKDIGTSLDRAFKDNVQSHEKQLRALKRKATMLGRQDGPSQLKLQTNVQIPSSIIWTPNHGYVEPGSKRFGLHQDPKELFLKTVDSDLAEEAYAAYLDLQENDEEDEDYTLFDHGQARTQHKNVVSQEGGGACVFDDHSAADQAQDLYVYGEEGELDQFYGTMSGGDD